MQPGDTDVLEHNMHVELCIQFSATHLVLADAYRIYSAVFR